MTAQTIRVLMIEDNPGDTALVQEFLSECEGPSFVLEAADRLSVGVDRLGRGGIDVVLLDLSLPDSEGLDTLDRVLAQAPTVPVLILTGQEEDALGLEAVRRGAQDYLIKGRLTGRGISRALRYSIERFGVRKQLREREEQLRLLCEQLPAVLWTTDRDLRFTSSHGAGLQQLSMEPGQLIGSTVSDFFKASGSEFLAVAEHYRALKGESGSFEVAWEERTFQMRVEPFRQGEHIVGTIGLALDVTDNRRVEEEFRLARQIQQGLLPSAAPSGLPRFDIGGCSHPAEATGGDFFDYIPFQDGSVGIAIGDVSNHGFGPALLAAVSHASLRTLALTGKPIGLDTMLSTCNRLLCGDSGDEQFVTLLFVSLDPGTLSLTYSNAGHPPGYILDSSGRIKASLDATGLPLGTLPTESYPAPPAIKLESGDLLFLLTDGILEAMAPDNGCFGKQRALEVVQSSRHLSAQEIAAALCHAAREFCRNVPHRDDLTAVILKVRD